MSKDYQRAKAAGLTQADRWGEGRDHHPMSERIVKFLALHDFHDYGDSFCWETGGDGDNGETLAYQLDALFELIDLEGGQR